MTKTSLANNFVQSTLDQVKLSLEKEFEAKADELLAELKKKLMAQVMTSLNGTRVLLQQSMGNNCLEIIITVKGEG